MHFPLLYLQGSAYERGRKMCEKLKEEIPRQLFEIPIQAAVGGKIIARETVQAQCEKMYWQNVMVVIFPVRRNFWKNRRKERNECVRWEM